MIAPTGRLKGKKRDFYEIVNDMRYVVCSVIRHRPMQSGNGAAALGTGFFVSKDTFITCNHVMNNPDDPHQVGDSYQLVANLTGDSGKIYSTKQTPGRNRDTSVSKFGSGDIKGSKHGTGSTFRAARIW